ncbi:hypothetical protein BC936DRAFT_141496 [Jimgerdemannia flammicorona]|uniref:Uncharacterized protein n=2 Tax=Jimgerdemannia flammicorona TaxID=994334 RepID=A0A433A246_9FUNG|nr:hypothetical protein BC936DRAFT_141496 [Jimgerdemannia flammicorona]RUS35405.1 hypothetical protein BC938DRAFT_470555 [Jimgerdemannia flammicorona]
MSLPLELRRKVLIAYDNSLCAQKTYKYAIDKVLIPGRDHVVIVSVINADKSKWFDKPSLDAAAAWGLVEEEDYRKRVKEIESNTETILNGITAEIRESVKDVTTQIVVLHGSAGAEIAKYAADAHVDLLVVGTRGLGAVKRNIVGSVSDFLVHNAHTSVLVAKPTGNDVTH